MRNMFAILTALLLSVGVMSLQAQPQQYLTILNLNDSHSNLLPGMPRDASYQGQVGGIARAATVINQYRSAEDRVIVLHAGDACVGDPMYNLPAGIAYRCPDMELLNLLGIDAMACGNHEFDFGADMLYAMLGNANPTYPLLSANIQLDATYQSMLGPYIDDYAVITRGPFRVGVVGVTTPSTNIMLTPGGGVWFKGMNGQEMGEVMQSVGNLIAGHLIPVEHCNVIVLLSHMGIDIDREFAKNVPYIDLIVSGHDHISMKHAEEVKNQITKEKVSIVTTGGFYREMGAVQVRLHNDRVDVMGYTPIALDATIPEDPVVAGAVQLVQQDIEDALDGTLLASMFTAPVAMCSGFFTEEATGLMSPGSKDTHVGNLMADAFETIPGVDIGLEPGGSTAQPLREGPVLPVDLFRMIGYGADPDGKNPLGYPVVYFTMQGHAIKAGLEATLKDIDVNDEMLLQVSASMQYFYDPHEAAGQRVKGILYKGQQMDLNDTYTVATNYLVLRYLGMLNIPHGTVNTLTDMQTDPTAISEFELVLDYIVNGLNSVLTAGKKPGRVQAICSSVIIPSAINPSMAKISSNSPNPFTGETVVTWSLEGATPVTLKVYDTVGREVATLHDGYATEGVHTVSFRALNLPAGLYFCRLQTGAGEIKTLKMLKTR